MTCFLIILLLTIVSAYHIKVIDGLSLNPFSVIGNFQKTEHTAPVIYGIGLIALLFVPCIHIVSLLNFSVLIFGTYFMLKYLFWKQDAGQVLSYISTKAEDTLLILDQLLSRIGLFRSV